MNNNGFLRGIRDGVPIGLGYFVVSFSLGIIAKKSGVLFYQGFLASFLNHASAGEYALFDHFFQRKISVAARRLPLMMDPHEHAGSARAARPTRTRRTPGHRAIRSAAGSGIRGTVTAH